MPQSLTLRASIAAVFAALSLASAAAAQTVQRCGTMQHLATLQQQDPRIAASMAAIEAQTQAYIASGAAGTADVVRTIPVVVHIVWNTAAENLSDAQVQSQIQVLNEDFRRANADASQTLAQFQGVAADAEIQFCLATRDPQGNPTTGITRTQTSVTSFSDANDAVKFSAQGGRDAWSTANYLNIWVCDLVSGLVGYAQFPGGPASTDGVVLDYQYFGRLGSAVAPYNLGRSATHEVGHWLNLIHIWGDAEPSCGTDLVSDTPPANGPHFSCNLSASSCGGTNMIQNYMDYTDDVCMNLFTSGQKARMQALFNAGGARASLLNSLGCQSNTPQWQVNQLHAGLDIDGVVGTSTTLAVTTKCTGATGTVHLLGTNTDLGLGSDVGLSLAPAVGASSGGVVLPGGQIVNLSLSGLLFLNSGTGAANLLPWPGNLSIPYTIAGPGVITLQRLQATPAIPLGLALSQPGQLTMTPNSTLPGGPTGDDSSVTVSLAGTCIGSIAMYGTVYTQCFVSSNGRVLFGGSDTDYSPTLAEALGDNRFVGFWTDLNPSAGGSIALTNPAGARLRVAWNAVPFFGQTALNTFAIEFDGASGAVTLDGLLGIPANPQAGTSDPGMNQFLGICRGGGVAVDIGATSFAPGASGSPANANAMIYQFYERATQTGGLVPSLLNTALNRIVFTPTAANGYSWAGF